MVYRTHYNTYEHRMHQKILKQEESFRTKESLKLVAWSLLIPVPMALFFAVSLYVIR